MSGELEQPNAKRLQEIRSAKSFSELLTEDSPMTTLQQTPEPKKWKCEQCGEEMEVECTSHSRQEHDPRCDGTCVGQSGICPIEVQCGPVVPTPTPEQTREAMDAIEFVLFRIDHRESEDERGIIVAAREQFKRVSLALSEQGKEHQAIAAGLLRAIDDLHYIDGIVTRGTGVESGPEDSARSRILEYVKSLESRLTALRAERDGARTLLTVLGCPQILIDHPTLLDGKPTEESMAWAKGVIAKRNAALLH